MERINRTRGGKMSRKKQLKQLPLHRRISRYLQLAFVLNNPFLSIFEARHAAKRLRDYMDRKDNIK